MITMDFSLGYLVQRFFFRVIDFFHHWYTDGSRLFSHRFFTLLGDLDQTIALRLTLKHFFEPLFKDYTIVGRVLGVIFRLGRVLLGFIIYPVVGFLFLFFYALWLVIPPFIALYALNLF